MTVELTFSLDERNFPARITRAYAAGYTGRDQDAVQAHVDELAAQGIAPPPHVPMLYPLIPTLLTTADTICLLGEHSTPEVEVAFLRIDGVDYVTVASDQTDRRVEARSIPLAKTACPKPLGRELWRLDDVIEHWDRLELSSQSGGTQLQAGALAKLLAPRDLFAFVEAQVGGRENTVVLGGTVPTEATPPADGGRINLRLSDPVRKRALFHAYRYEVLQPFFGEELP